MAFVCSDVNLFRNFVTVRPAHEKALSDGAEEAGTKVRLPIRGTRQCDYHYNSYWPAINAI